MTLHPHNATNFIKISEVAFIGKKNGAVGNSKASIEQMGAGGRKNIMCDSKMY